jgi:diguanylate cyclase (GGDEF)-like protein/PAS domain S-box-containing protein
MIELGTQQGAEKTTTDAGTVVTTFNEMLLPLPDAGCSVRNRVAPLPDSATLILNQGGQIRLCSLAAGQLFGYEISRVIDMHISALIPDLPLRGNTPGYNLAFAHFVPGGTRWRSFHGRDAAGRCFPLSIAIDYLKLDRGRGFVLNVQPECPGLPQRGSGLTRLINAIHNDDTAMFITDRCGHIEHANPAFTRLTGFGPAEIMGLTPALLKSGVQPAAFYDRMWSTLNCGDEFRCVIANRRKDGSRFYANEYIRPFVDEQGRITHYVASMHDITEHVLQHARINRMANYDRVTGLPNRNLFLDRLSQEIHRARRTSNVFALAFVDLDDFKLINDRYGHATGDEVLNAIGTQLNRCVRDTDTIARLGGDEFVLILPGVGDRQSVLEMRQKIEGAGHHIVAGGLNLSLSLSCGMAFYPCDGKTETQLLEAADQAMYSIKKRRGRATTAAVQTALYAPAPKLRRTPAGWIGTEQRPATKRKNPGLRPEYSPAGKGAR